MLWIIHNLLVLNEREGQERGSFFIFFFSEESRVAVKSTLPAGFYKLNPKLAMAHRYSGQFLRRLHNSIPISLCCIPIDVLT